MVLYPDPCFLRREFHKSIRQKSRLPRHLTVCPNPFGKLRSIDTADPQLKAYYSFLIYINDLHLLLPCSTLLNAYNLKLWSTNNLLVQVGICAVTRRLADWRKLAMIKRSHMKSTSTRYQKSHRGYRLSPASYREQYWTVPPIFHSLLLSWAQS